MFGFGWLTKLFDTDEGRRTGETAYIWHERNPDGSITHFYVKLGDGEKQRMPMSRYNPTLGKLYSNGNSVVTDCPPEEKDRLKATAEAARFAKAAKSAKIKNS